MQNRALTSFLKTIIYGMMGRLRFSKDRIGHVIKMDDGTEYTIFRQVFVNHKSSRMKGSGVQLVIRFNFAHGSPRQNKLLSLIPIPFITGLPGFGSKTWALQKANGGFQGIYEWDSVEDAEAYKRSFAIKLMTKRAVPGSITFQIIP